MISEWEVPAKLQTPEGELRFNQTLSGTSDSRLVLNPRRCESVLGVRRTDDDVPQADGAIPHRRFRTGYQLHLAFELVQAWNGGDVDPATGEDLVDMVDLIGLHINSMVRTGVAVGALNARFHWTPTGKSDRMFDRLQLAGEPALTLDGDLGCSIYEVDLDTCFPYYISSAETSTSLDDGETATITNAGNTDYFPVVQAYGPYDSFELRNNSVTDFDGNPVRLVYDELLPGGVTIAAGTYVEFIFFLQSAYLSGSGANRKAGIDMSISEFFPLAPGENELEAFFGGGTAASHFVVKSNDAWA